MARRVVIFGPPGVGKGTHAKRLASDLGILHVATGDLLRSEIQAGTTLGQEAAAFIARGELVPDQVVVALLEARLGRPEAVDGYLLDGFPRTLGQAQIFADRLLMTSQRLDVVLCMQASDELLARRIARRVICAGCGATSRREDNPAAVASTCPRCGGQWAQRPDDREDVVLRRLKRYHETTAPVLEFFGARGWPIRFVNASGTIDEVFEEVRSATLQELARS